MKPLVLKLHTHWRTRLEQEAATKNVSATDLLHMIIAERYTPGEHNPFDATASIPRRMLEVERWHGLSVTESAQSLAAFGIERVADLATPDKLLAGLDKEKLTAFAALYEVDLDWLRTGEGWPYKPTHVGWYAFDIARRIIDLWIAGELNRVRFVADKTTGRGFEGAHVVVVLEKRHPATLYQDRDPYTVNESYPVLSWNRDQRWLLANLILFCHHLHQETRAQEVYPWGVTLTEEAFWRVRSGKLHLAHALRDHTTNAWQPEGEARHLDPATRTFGDDHDWKLLEKVLADARLRWSGRKELLGGR